MGLVRKRGKEPGATKEFAAAVATHHNGLYMEDQQDHFSENGTNKYLGRSHTVAIDLNTSNFQPVPQSTATRTSSGATAKR